MNLLTLAIKQNVEIHRNMEVNFNFVEILWGHKEQGNRQIDIFRHNLYCQWEEHVKHNVIFNVSLRESARKAALKLIWYEFYHIDHSRCHISAMHIKPGYSINISREMSICTCICNDNFCINPQIKQIRQQALQPLPYL